MILFLILKEIFRKEKMIQIMKSLFIDTEAEESVKSLKELDDVKKY